jgi:type VI secretion system protein ImpL
VAEWTVRSNYENAVSLSDKSRQAQWLCGCPTTVTFRWPKVPGLEQSPLNDPGQPALHVLDSVATFSYGGRWSVLRMIRRHKAKRSEYVPMMNPNTVVLKFSVPVGNDKTAVLFNAVSFMGPSANANLSGKAIPFPDFPTMAPDIPTDVETLLKEPVLSCGILQSATSLQLRKALLSSG